MAQQTIIEFIGNSQFSRFLDRCWAAEGYYIDPHADNRFPDPQINHYLGLYHLYAVLLNIAGPHRERHAAILKTACSLVRPDAFLRTGENTATDHPAFASHMADLLGTSAFYAKELALSQDLRDAALAALLRFADLHPQVGYPHGVAGKSQQMRFETRVYYWAWRLTQQERYHKAFLELYNNGVNAYTNPAAIIAGLNQPAVHPDWTWNYNSACGTTHEYATNTHTPIYYCTEPQGFVFVYLHGLRTGALEVNPVWSEFARSFLMGLARNLSRAGFTSVDVDGYGIHRAWFNATMLESIPLEAAAAEKIGLSAEWTQRFRWYVDQYIDFVRRSSSFEESGLPPAQPFGHRIGIERQFARLTAGRFYALLARAAYEFPQVNEMCPQEPPAFASYAWWHNWLRVSTPRYETSFAGATSLRFIPMVKNFGDPHLGCIHGGSPLSTLMVGRDLMYATSNDTAGLWHVETTDVNENTHRSCATSFADEIAMSVADSDGNLLSAESFIPYESPHVQPLNQNNFQVDWHKKLRASGITFFTHHDYRERDLGFTWGVRAPRGFYLRKAAFHVPIPANMSPEAMFENGRWETLAAGKSWPIWPLAIRWRKPESGTVVTVDIAPIQKSIVSETLVVAIPSDPGRPGGDNCFCPFPLLQIRMDIKLSPQQTRYAMRCEFSFD